MIIVTTVDGGKSQYTTATRFLTEEMFNNLCIHGDGDVLLAVFAQDQWRKIEVIDDGD